MKKRHKKEHKYCQILRYNKGFSLIELMIGLVLAIMISMAGFVIFESSDRAYNTQEDVSVMQQNVRVAMDRIIKDIRTAGFGLPSPPFSLAFDTDGNGSDDLTLTSHITYTNNSTSPDTITILGIGYESTKLVEASSNYNRLGNTFICVEDDSDFRPSGTYDRNRRHISIGGQIYREIVSASGSSCGTGKQLPLLSSLDRDYPDNTPVYIIQAVQYSIDSSGICTALNPCLSSDDYSGLRGSSSQILAENIEDLQFAYGIDASPKDGKIDYTGNYDSSDFLNSPADPLAVIAVRVNIVGRSEDPDINGVTVFQRPALEDRVAGAADGYRRRVLTKVVRLRNPAN